MSIYTKIIDGEIPGRFVWADDECVAIATIEPHADGHVLVIPREEVDRFTDLETSTFLHLAEVAQRIGASQEKVFDVPRSGLVIAGLGVPHVHLHVIPMLDESVLSFEAARRDEPQEAIDSAMEKLRDQLVADGWGDFVPATMESLS